MTEMKSQFFGTGSAGNLNHSYIDASLNFMTADTRGGLANAAALLNVIKGQIGKPHVAAYVARFEPVEAAVTVTLAAGNKPNSSGKM
jgi:hypothetical protein